jgi:hypothetical protein
VLAQSFGQVRALRGSSVVGFGSPHGSILAAKETTRNTHEKLFKARLGASALARSCRTF